MCGKHHKPAQGRLFVFGGSGEIRTHERLATLPVFKTGAFNHSATLPYSGSDAMRARILHTLPPQSRINSAAEKFA
jgi:hypothetical protein